MQKKLKYISSLLLHSDAYKRVTLNPSAQLYDGLEEALHQLGLPSIKDFIKHEI